MENLKCPLCGSKEIGQGKQGQSRMIPMNKFWTTGSEIIADICTNCGHILSMKVRRPEIFKEKR